MRLMGLKLRKNKKAEGSDEVIKWILYLLLIGVGFVVIRNVFLR
jgi:hypothetical protein